MCHEKQKLRKVKYYIREDGKMKEKYGRFHAWGYDYKEFGLEAVSFSVAIVENQDGSMSLCDVESVWFVK